MVGGLAPDYQREAEGAELGNSGHQSFPAGTVDFAVQVNGDPVIWEREIILQNESSVSQTF